MTPESMAAINRVVNWANNRPDQLYTPGKTIGQFLGSTSRLALGVMANQTGKTTSLCWFANKCCLAFDKSKGGPGVFLFMIADLDNHYPTVCQKLWEVCARSELDPNTKYTDGKGFYTHGKRLVKFKNGARIEWRGGKGEVMAVAGVTADLGGACDEIPMRGHFAEFLRACQRWSAPVRVGFTAVGRPAEWFEERVRGREGRPPGDVDSDGQPMWDLYQCAYSVEECPWLTQEQVDETIAQTDPAQIPQRIYGEWEGPTMDRRFTGMRKSNIIVEPPTAFYKVHVGMDHGENVGHQTAVSIFEDPKSGKVIITDDYVNERATTTEADADAISVMLDSRNMTIMSVDRWVGDVNSGGKNAEGASINTLLEEAFADMLGVGNCPFRIETAQKGAGSVAFGERMINLALERGDLLVCESAARAIRALWGYRGAKRDPEAHIIDAIRYTVLPILQKNPTYSTLFVRR